MFIWTLHDAIVVIIVALFALAFALLYIAVYAEKLWKRVRKAFRQ